MSDLKRHSQQLREMLCCLQRHSHPHPHSHSQQGARRGGGGGGEARRQKKVVCSLLALFCLVSGIFVFWLILMQPSTAPPPRLHALQRPQCAAPTVHYPSCKDEGVSRQSGARMLYCCPYRESNTRIEEVGKNQGIRFTQPKIRTRILCICIICSY